VTDTLIIKWEEPGLHPISVTATNQVGTVDDTWEITIYIRQFLPISMRN
jgi:hypothetical protein